MAASHMDEGGPLQPIANLIEGIAKFPGDVADSIRKVMTLREDFSIKTLENIASDLGKLRFEPGGLRTSVQEFLEHPSPKGLELIRRQIETSAPILQKLDRMTEKNKYVEARDHRTMDIIRQVGKTKLGLFELLDGQHALNRYLNAVNKGDEARATETLAFRRRFAASLDALFTETNRKIDEARDRLAEFIKSREAAHRGSGS